MEKEKKERIIEVVNLIYQYAGYKLSQPILKMWLEDLEEKSVRQIDYAFKKYRREYTGKPSIEVFLQKTNIPPHERKVEREPTGKGIPMPKEVKDKLEALKKKMLMGDN